MVGGYSERIRLLIGELTIVWVVFLSIRINKWIAEDLLLVNATRRKEPKHPMGRGARAKRQKSYR